MSIRNRMRSIDVPRNCADRQTVPTWQGTRDALEQHGRALSEYSVSVSMPPNGTIRVLDTKYAPVGLWNMHLGAVVGAKDYSGNANDLTVETGTARYTRLYPGPNGGGLLFDGATNMWVNATPAVLRLLGAMTMLAICLWSDLPTGTNVRTIASHAASGELSTANYLYRFGVDLNNQAQYFSEHAGGTDDIATGQSFVPRGQLHLLGMTRSAGGVVTYWEDGVALPSLGTVTLPTDGSLGKFRLGGGPAGAAEFFTGVISSCGLYASELTTAQMVERYNYCLGAAFGFRDSGIAGDDLRPVMSVDEDAELLRAALVPDALSGAFAAGDASFSLYRIDSSGSLATVQLLASIDRTAASAKAWSPFRAQEMRLAATPAVVKKGDVLAISGKTSSFNGDLDLRFGRIAA